MEPKKDNTFCYFPFHQLALKSWVKGQGIFNVAPCCNSVRPEHIDPLNTAHYFVGDEKPTASQLFHSPEMQDLRAAMLRGDRHPACQVCWKMEDRNPDNPSSYRFFSTPSADMDIDEPQLRTIDFMFGEECNLRCRMCMPGLSNKLRHDYRYFHKNNVDVTGIAGFERRLPESGEEWYIDDDSHKKVNHFDEGPQWQDILDNITHLREIKATGGETTLTKPFIQFLDRAIETGANEKIKMSFHTNATKFTNELIGKLKTFKKLSLECSIDSVGKNYEYIRYPMKWEKLDKSINNFLSKTIDRPDLISNFNFTVVLSSLNAFHLIDLIEYHRSLWQEYKHVTNYVFYIDMLHPENKFINVKFLTPELKYDILEQLTEAAKTSYLETRIDGKDYHSYQLLNIQAAIDFIDQHKDTMPTEQNRLNMLREITVFDQSRDQDYHDYLDPRIVRYLETPLG